MPVEVRPETFSMVFFDAADEAFERLWTADGLTWADISGASAGARAALAS
jgi:hypothetical protein